MEQKVVVLCGMVAILGIISAVAGIVAEVTKVKASEVYIEGYSCVYPRSPAAGLAIVAAIFAIINRVVLLFLVGCCCRTRDSISTPIQNVFNIFSWVASVIAVILLLGGAALNIKAGGEKETSYTITCYVVKPGILVAGAVFSLLSAITGIVAYISVSSAKQAILRVELPLPVATSISDLEKSSVHPQQ